MTATTTLVFAFMTLIPIASGTLPVSKARATIYQAVAGGNPSTAIGVLEVKQCRGVMTINGTVSGLPPGLHGFHVHEYGDLGNGCLAAGNHYNPFKRNHGGPKSLSSRRHVGDLGSIMTPDQIPTSSSSFPPRPTVHPQS